MAKANGMPSRVMMSADERKRDLRRTDPPSARSVSNPIAPPPRCNVRVRRNSSGTDPSSRQEKAAPLRERNIERSSIKAGSGRAGVPKIPGPAVPDMETRRRGRPARRSCAGSAPSARSMSKIAEMLNGKSWGRNSRSDRTGRAALLGTQRRFRTRSSGRARR